MTDREILEMQRRIDEGILLAQQRLWHRAGILGQTLVVARGESIVETIPSADDSSTSSVLEGNPLGRRSMK